MNTPAVERRSPRRRAIAAVAAAIVHVRGAAFQLGKARQDLYDDGGMDLSDAVAVGTAVEILKIMETRLAGLKAPLEPPARRARP